MRNKTISTMLFFYAALCLFAALILSIEFMRPIKPVMAFERDTAMDQLLFSLMPTTSDLPSGIEWKQLSDSPKNSTYGSSYQVARNWDGYKKVQCQRSPYSEWFRIACNLMHHDYFKQTEDEHRSFNLKFHSSSGKTEPYLGLPGGVLLTYFDPGKGGNYYSCTIHYQIYFWKSSSIHGYVDTRSQVSFRNYSEPCQPPYDTRVAQAQALCRSECERLAKLLWSRLPVETPGAIYVKSTPGDAEIWINGKQYANTTFQGAPFGITNLPPGNYTITVRKQGYKNYTKTIQLKSNQIENVDARLEPGVMSSVPAVIPPQPPPPPVIEPIGEPPLEPDKLPDSALPIAVGATAVLAGLGALATLFVQGISIKDAYSEMSGLFSGQTFTEAATPAITEDETAEQMAGQKALEELGAERGAQVGVHEEGDFNENGEVWSEAARGWVSRDDYDKVNTPKRQWDELMVEQKDREFKDALRADQLNNPRWQKLKKQYDQMKYDNEELDRFTLSGLTRTLFTCRDPHGNLSVEAIGMQMTIIAATGGLGAIPLRICGATFEIPYVAAGFAGGYGAYGTYDRVQAGESIYTAAPKAFGEAAAWEVGGTVVGKGISKGMGWGLNKVMGTTAGEATEAATKAGKAGAAAGEVSEGVEEISKAGAKAGKEAVEEATETAASKAGQPAAKTIEDLNPEGLSKKIMDNATLGPDGKLRANVDDVLEIQSKSRATRTLKNAPEEAREAFNRTLREEIYDPHDRELIGMLEQKFPKLKGKFQVDDFRTPGKKYNVDADINTDRDFRILYTDEMGNKIEIPRKYWEQDSNRIFKKLSGYDPQELGHTPTDKFHTEASRAYSDQGLTPDGKRLQVPKNIEEAKLGTARLEDAEGLGMMYKEKVEVYMRQGNIPEAVAQGKKVIDTFEKAVGEAPDNFKKAMELVKNAPVDYRATPEVMNKLEAEIRDLGFGGFEDFNNKLCSRLGATK